RHTRSKRDWSSDVCSSDLGYGAVAVTDTSRVLAFVGAGADHHGPGDVPIRPVFEALAEDETRIAPLALRVACGHRACPLGAAAKIGRASCRESVWIWVVGG